MGIRRATEIQDKMKSTIKRRSSADSCGLRVASRLHVHLARYISRKDTAFIGRGATEDAENYIFGGENSND